MTTYSRPTNRELAFAKELGTGRFATALAVNGCVVKRLKDAVVFDDGTVENADLELLRVNEGTRRLQEAGVPVLPVLDEWTEGKSTYYAQERVKVIETWTQEQVYEGLELAKAAFGAGVADVLPKNTGLDSNGNLVILDAGELCDPDDEDDQMMQGETEWHWGKVARSPWATGI